jgi:spermidine/putrescine transport system substrate-binding protein
MTGSWHDLWNDQARGHVFTLDDQDEALAMAGLLLGYDVNTAKSSELADIKDLLISQKDYLRAYSSDDINNIVGGDAWVHHMWSGDFLYLRQGLADDPTTLDFEAPKEGTPINSDTYAIPANAQHPGTAMVFIDYLLRPENAIRNMNYLYYPFPVKDALPAFADLAKDVPACNVEISDLENENVFRLLGADEQQRRAATWTEVKAS